tara:strand:- start:1344 stop:4109 length:2766 start_codon:yes stop_codon:yes gene_type:complete
MPAISQRVDNYLGGVSRQSDDKKLPGQVKECLNGYPDPTFGLTKRPGFNWIANLGTGTTYDNSKWFYIARTKDERYIGCITPKPTSGFGDIDIWNVDGTACTVNMDTSTSVNAVNYLTGSRLNYEVLTVQDTSIITNNLVTVAKQADPTFNANRKATLVLSGSPVSNVYTVVVDGNTITHTSNASGTYDSILTAIKTAIDALSISGLSTVKYRESLQLTDSNSTITITATGGQAGDSMYVFQDQVDNVTMLPQQSFNGHVVKIMNTTSTDDTYFAKFIADDGTSGPGHWAEGLDPATSVGLDASTMPHELVNSSLNTFTFRQVSWTARAVGDDNTNSHPSFVGAKIQAGFFYNNRLGFCSADNVSMSQSQEFFNFYHTSAQTVTDADPIDLSVSTIRPATLVSVLPTTQGLLLFSKDQQFLLSSADGVLTPTTANARAISNYDMDIDITPVDMGGIIQFVSKTPSYTRIFGMQTFGQDENPKILDIGRVVNEWVPESVDTLIASPQNKFLAMSDQSSRYIYFFRTYNDGKENLVEAWFNWQLPGTVQTIAVDSDDFFAVTKQGSQFTLSQASLSQSPQDAIIVNNDGSAINPCMDLYKEAPNVTYRTSEDFSKCYIPWNNVSGLSPVIIIKGTTATGQFIESGFTTTPTVATDTNWAASTAYIVGDVVVNDSDKVYVCDTAGTSAGSGGPTGTSANITDGSARWDYLRTGSTYFKVLRKDLSGVASDVVVGWKYDYDIILPKTYFRSDEKMKLTDFTASLTINRMKFALGLSGVCGFKLKQTGRLPGSKEFTGDGSTTVYNWIAEDFTYVDDDQIKCSIDGVTTTAFTVSADKQVTFDSAPANNTEIKIFLDEWYNLSPTTIADTYLGNDIAIKDQSVVSIPIHQRTNNFQLRVFNDSPFPVSLNSMMWEGHYSPMFYRRR